MLHSCYWSAGVKIFRLRSVVDVTRYRKTYLLDTRGDLNGPNVDCHSGEVE